MSKKQKTPIAKDLKLVKIQTYRFPIFIKSKSDYYKFLSPKEHVLVANQERGSFILYNIGMNNEKTNDWKTYSANPEKFTKITSIKFLQVFNLVVKKLKDL